MWFWNFVKFFWATFFHLRHRIPCFSLHLSRNPRHHPHLLPSTTFKPSQPLDYLPIFAAQELRPSFAIFLSTPYRCLSECAFAASYQKIWSSCDNQERFFPMRLSLISETVVSKNKMNSFRILKFVPTYLLELKSATCGLVCKKSS